MSFFIGFNLKRQKINIVVILIGYGLATLIILWKLLSIGLLMHPRSHEDRTGTHLHRRPEITDRNGNLLGTDLPTYSVFADARDVSDPDEAAEKLNQVLPELGVRGIRDKLLQKRSFVWIKRDITQGQQIAIENLGIPGIQFLPSYKRYYPNLELAAHVIGTVDNDRQGIAGIERYLDQCCRGPVQPEKVTLSLDLRIQFALTEALKNGIKEYQAQAGTALIMDVRNGEVLALASLPDFDPNTPSDAIQPNRFNRATIGTYEMGSTAKIITLAMALESGRYTLDSEFDLSSGALSVENAKIHDFHMKQHTLTLSQAFLYSSNIVFSKVVLAIGQEEQKRFLSALDLFSRVRTEILEVSSPVLPKKWTELTSATVSFGHGIAFTPLQFARAIAALVNGGTLYPITFLKRSTPYDSSGMKKVIRRSTSQKLLETMRHDALVGTAKVVDLTGYDIGAKTGTAEKVINGTYSKEHVVTTFVAVTPTQHPRYLVLTVLDDPKATESTHWNRTAAWNAGRITRNILMNTLPLMGELPNLSSVRQTIAPKGESHNNVY